MMLNKELLLSQNQVQKSSFTVSGILVNNYGSGGASADLVDTTMEPVPVNLFGQQVHIIDFGSTSRSTGYSIYLRFQEKIFTPYNTFFHITFSGDYSGEYIGIFNQADGFRIDDSYFFAINGHPEKGDFIQADVKCWHATNLPKASLSVTVKSKSYYGISDIAGYFPENNGLIVLDDLTLNKAYTFTTCMQGVVQKVGGYWNRYPVLSYSGMEKIGENYLITAPNASIVFDADTVGDT